MRAALLALLLAAGAIAQTNPTGDDRAFPVEPSEQFWVGCDYREALASIASVEVVPVAGPQAPTPVPTPQFITASGIEAHNMSCRCDGCCAAIFVDPSSCTGCKPGVKYQITIHAQPVAGGVKNCHLRADLNAVQFHP
jgi:hypothetical protein